MRKYLHTIFYFSAHSEYEKRANLDPNVISNPDIPITVKLEKVESPYDLSVGISSIDVAPGKVKIIIDYLSFTNDKTNWNKYSQVVRDAIVSYPEYDFYFDVTYKHNEDATIVSFIIYEAGISDGDKERISKKVDISVHEFNTQERTKLNAYHKIVMGKSNSFDASNLRWASMEIKYILQGQKGRNFQQIQDSRNSNLASCVHSDDESTILHCYLLFASGYRSIPVSSTYELNRNCGKVPLIIRDWNLLFANEDRISGENARPAILGYKIEDGNIELVESDYWDWGKKYFFISCECEKKLEKSAAEITRNNNNIVNLPGTVSPTINGIYKDISTILQLNIISESSPNYERENVSINKSIDTQKMIQEMNERANRYYKQKYYVYSALVARIALELNNGFFQTLSAKSIYILSLAENAIAVNNLLGDEELIAEDAKIRIKFIEKEVKRLLNKTASSNLTHQIFSDCRYYCKEKERFKSEDVFISEMAHINDGFSITNLFRDGFKALTRSLRKTFKK